MDHLLEWENFDPTNESQVKGKIFKSYDNKNEKEYNQKVKELSEFLKSLNGDFYSKENYNKIDDKIRELILVSQDDKYPSDIKVSNGWESVVYAFNHGKKMPSFEQFSYKLSESLELNESSKTMLSSDIIEGFINDKKIKKSKLEKYLKSSFDIVTDNIAQHLIDSKEEENIKPFATFNDADLYWINDYIFIDYDYYLYMSKDGLKTLKDSGINEAKTVIKRKYSEFYPARHVYSNADKRNKVLSFIESKGGTITEEEMSELTNSVDEETGPTISKAWIFKNRHLISVKGIKETKTYKITDEGKRVLKAIKKHQLKEDGGMSTLDNTPGMGPVVPPTSDSVGSGDRFDNNVACDGTEDCKCKKCTEQLDEAKLLSIDLLKKYNDKDKTEFKDGFEKFKSKIKGFTNSNKEFNLKTGDIIDFIGGYDSDIKYRSEILGFDSDGEAYVLWDCYWMPLNLNKRLVK